MRTVTAKFDVPWHYVRHLEGCERIRIADASIPGWQMTGKVVSMEASLVTQKATITIASAPGTGGGKGTLTQPQYYSPGFDQAGIIAADVFNEYYVQEQNIAAQLAAGNDPDINRLLADMSTKMVIEMSPLPKGGNAEVTIDLGSVTVDCEQMVDLN